MQRQWRRAPAPPPRKSMNLPSSAAVAAFALQGSTPLSSRLLLLMQSLSDVNCNLEATSHGKAIIQSGGCASDIRVVFRHVPAYGGLPEGLGLATSAGTSDAGFLTSSSCLHDLGRDATCLPCALTSVNIMDRVIPDFYAACMASGSYARALSKHSKNSFIASAGMRSRSRYALKHISSPPQRCQAAALTRHRFPKAVAFDFEPHGLTHPREAPSVLQEARDGGLHLPNAECGGASAFLSWTCSVLPYSFYHVLGIVLDG